MKLIEEAYRQTKLIKAGVPIVFFNLLDKIEDYPELDIFPPEGAYLHVPTMQKYEIFKDYSVVPVCDIGEGDSFLLYLFNDNEQKFVYCALEADEIFEDYGMDTGKMFANLLIDAYDFMSEEIFEDEVSETEIQETLEYITSLGTKMGLKETVAKKIVDRLYLSDVEEEDRYEGEDQWITDNIHSLLK